jgi:CheY-like chemotaxis protein
VTPLKTKFLLADDDADDAQIFCEALCRIATVMQCYKVENGREVFDFLSEAETRIGKPDVIFLDINMPIMNGWECLKELRSNPNYSSIPAIMYSTSSAKRDIDLAYSLGASLFLTKPDDFRELCTILEIVATNPLDSLLNHLRGFGSVKVA